MIPVRLAVEGLYSYQHKQEVDFRQLVGSSVFGIFGRVGSGKTSLLEAISFVLYGESERLNSRDDRAYNMMNLKSGQLLIDFEFRAGADGQLYRYVYEAKRHAKKRHEIKDASRRAFRWDNNAWVPLPLEKEHIGRFTREILGLDYDNFKRTIIIPQNQFREFLELSPKDRTEMMSRLFGLDKYDLSERTTALARCNDHELAELAGSMKHLESITPESLADARAQVDALTAQLTTFDEPIRQQQAAERALIELRGLETQLQTAQGNVVTLEADAPAYQRQLTDIEQYEQCRLLFLTDVQRSAQLRHDAEKFALRQHEAEQQQAALQLLRPGIDTAYQAARRAYETRDQLQLKISELEVVARIRSIENSAVTQEQQLNQLRAHLTTLAERVVERKTARTAVQARIDALTALAADLSRLYDIRRWFTEKQPLAGNVVALNAELERLQAKIDVVKGRKDELLTNYPAEWTELPLKDVPARFKDHLQLLEQQRDAQQRSVNKLEVQRQLTEYATQLEAGEPCPLCGSEQHPNVRSAASVERELAEHQRELSALSAQLKHSHAVLLEVQNLLGELRTHWKTYGEKQQDLTQANQALTAHLDTFRWAEFSPEDDQPVLAAIDTEHERQQRVQQAQTERSDLDRLVEDALAEQNRAAVDVGRLEEAIRGLRATVAADYAGLKQFRPAEVQPLSMADINALTDELAHEYERVKTVFDAASRQKQEADTKSATLSEEILHYVRLQQDVQREADAVHAQLDLKLRAHGFTLPNVVAQLATERDTTTERQRIQAFCDALTTARNVVNELTTKLAGRSFDADALAAVQQTLSDLHSRRDALNQQLGEARSALNDLTEKWAQKQQLGGQYDALKARQQDLAELTSLFRGQGFVKYVSSVYLSELCASANERFAKLTNNQLKLEFRDDNFIIRDYLNGGQTRLAKTLSGGQMFQASLCLALALSDNIQHLTQSKQNLFFLDEGFGTLDKDSLQTVFKTLKALRQENRVVGIISHVEELQHEVDTFIRTVQTEDGSLIECSWQIA